MEMGQRIKQARLEAGLSQRQLCGDTITRNMLSLIENGAARPSMDTLSYLAQRLGKPIGWFLEEQAVASGNLEVMEKARTAWAARDLEALGMALGEFREPDAIFVEEWRLLQCLYCLQMARQALDAGKLPYAAQLAQQATGLRGAYITEDLIRQGKLLMGMAGGPVELEDEDPALLLRGRDALEREDPARAEEILLAAQNRDDPYWHLLAGTARAKLGKFASAVQSLEKAEAAYPQQAVPLLEQCCRELGDFKRAYEYACKGRDL